MEDEVALWVALGRAMDARPSCLHEQSFGLELAETLLRVRDRGGAMVPLVANAVQRRYERERGRQNIVLKARQMGLSTWIAGRFFLKTVLTPGTLTVQVAQTREAAEGIFRIAQRMWENLPQEMRMGVARRKKANVGQMVFAAMDSEFRVLSAADENCGRGLTIQNLHCTEVARWAGDAAETLVGLRAALAPGGEMVLESTPMGAHGCFYGEWMEAERRGVVRHFFPWWMEAAYVGEAVWDWNEEERRLVEGAGLTAEQIGFRRELKKTYRGLAEQEFAEDAVGCFKASGLCVFDVAAIEERLAAVPEPMRVERNGAWLVWLPMVAGRQYVVAVDPAGGGSEGDFAAVQVMDVATGMQCAELQQRISVRELAGFVVRVAAEYNDALVVVERNNHGSGVLAHLERTGVRLYEQRGQAGWLTSAASRAAMVSRLGALLCERAGVLMSRRLLLECRSFVSTASGRAEAAAGTQDDLVMAMAMGVAVSSGFRG